MSQWGNYPITEEYKHTVMHTQITQLKRENQDLKDLLYDLAPIIGKNISDFGLMDKELHAKVRSIVSGVKYNPLDWDMADKNGEQ